MPLTQQQAEAVQVLDWLLDEQGERRSGRSTAMAVALVRQALRYPGQPVYYLDHTSAYPPLRERAQLMRRLVEGLVRDDPAVMRLPWRFEPTRFTLLADVPELIPHDWMPVGMGDLRSFLRARQEVRHRSEVELGLRGQAPPAEEPLRHRPTFWERIMGNVEDSGIPFPEPTP